MAEGFLSRWAKRKEAVRKGEEVPAEPANEVAARVPPPHPKGGGRSQPAEGTAVPPSPLRGEGRGEGRPEDQPAPPTLEDVDSLTPDSDFTRFTRPDVAPEVKNAAMKKLFTDPHFNAMDGLDVYIDDYSKPDPLPPAMLKQLASARFLKLFEEKKQETGEVAAEPDATETREVADGPPADSVPQSGTRTAQALPPAEDHADPDLRLQQDDVPGARGPGTGSR